MPRKIPQGKPWPKGQSGNPAGCSAKVREAAAMARLRPQLAKVAPTLTPENLKLLIGGILMGTVSDVKAVQRDLGEEVMVLYNSLATCLAVCTKKGDIAGLLKIVEYVTGRSPDKLEMSGPDGGPIRTAAQMTDEEMIEELKRLRQRKKNVEP